MSLARNALLLPALALTACAPLLDFKWQPIDKLEHPSDSSKGAAAILFREDRRVIHLAGRFSYYQFQRHDVIEIRSEDGLKNADVRIPLGKDSRLLLLEARTLTPEGQIKPVDAASILKSSTKIGSEDQEGREMHYRVFRFPDVRPGSRIEYAYTIEEADSALSIMEAISDELPIEQYRLDLAITSVVDGSITAFNTNGQLKKERKGDLTHFRLALDHVAARHAEDWSAIGALREPWWIYRSIGYSFRSSRWYPRLSDWPHAVMPLAKKLYLERKPMAAAIAELPPAPTVRERIDAAVAAVHARVARNPERREDFEEHRPLKEIVASGQGNDVERTVYLWELLASHGVKAQYALATRWVPGALAHDVPSLRPFNHMFVYVPSQTGLDAALWIDVSCQYCRAGQVPPSLAGADALVFDAVDPRFGATEFKASFIAVTGEPPLATTRHDVYRARLEADSDLEVDALDECSGEETSDRAPELRRSSPEKVRETAVHFVTDRFAAGQLAEGFSDTCDAVAGRCARRLRFRLPSYATADGTRLLVPLTLLHHDWDDRFKKQLRHHPIAVPLADRVDEEVELRLPSSWRLEETAGTHHTASPAVDFWSDISVTTDGADSVVTIKRSAERHIGVFPPSAAGETAAALREFEAVRDHVLVFRKAK